VAHTNEITFFGFAFSGTKICWSDKAFVRLKQHLKELTGRSWGMASLG
jgi:RNA-directed DNA polymerase